MSDRPRVSETVLLCEDDVHQRLVKAYLRECGLKAESPYVRSLVASREVAGGNDAWVLRRFPEELHACRQRQKRAETRLIVVLDADHHTVRQRIQQLDEKLRAAEFDALKQDDPVVLLIPKRHGETWVWCPLGESVEEEEDCKKRGELDRSQFRAAATTLREWSRENATPGATCVESLKQALAGWRTIG